MNDPLRRTVGICAHCRRYTLNGRAEWVATCTGPDYRRIVHADPAECTQPPHYPDGGQPVALAA
jgi:hypothetical protein